MRYALVVVEAGDSIRSIALEVVDKRTAFTIALQDDGTPLPERLEHKLKEVIHEIVEYDKERK